MNYDVVVVGAGPAGSTAAKCLVENDIKVLLIDKKKFPRDKTCGGGLPTRVLKRFPYINSYIDSISYGSITYSSSFKYILKIYRDKPFLAMILRKDFDKTLLNIAVEKGAIFQSGKTVVDIKIQDDKAILQLNNGEKIESQVVIGCDGAKSIVAEKTKLCEKLDNICASLEQEQPMSKEQLDKYFTKKRIIHIFLKTQGIAGYGWIFPKKRHINLGIGEFKSALDKSKSKTNLKERYEKFIDMLKQREILPMDFQIENLKGGTLPIFPLEKTYTDRVLLCGDAAGFINPITGEGIYYAMTSGEIASNVVTRALQTGDTSEIFLSKYQKRWKKEFGKDLEILGRFNNQWGESNEKIIRLLTLDKTFAKLIVGVTGGQLSFSRYKPLLFLYYLYVSLKGSLIKK